MAWRDFEVASALERDVLRRALPALPSSGQSSARATLEAGQPLRIDVGVTDTMGATPEACVERLALRPLLVGAAWKVLDLLLEEALDQAGVLPDLRRGYSIELKQQKAQASLGRPTVLGVDAWEPLMSTYVATVEIRHSLVHRRARTDPAGALVGVDRAGNPLRAMTSDEQEAFARSVLEAADRVLGGSSDSRGEARLLRHLADLGALHGHQVRASALPAVVPELTVIVDADPADPKRYLLDVPDVRARNPFRESGDCADLIVAPRDRPGQELRGHLEDAPDDVVSVDPDAPPAWLV
jgi:hypothetical protein